MAETIGCQVREFLSEQSGRVGLRLLIRLFIGFAYVGLVVFARMRLWPDTALAGQGQAGPNR